MVLETLRKEIEMFGIIGKIVVVLFMITIGLTIFTFGFGWLMAIAWPIMLIAVPILLVVFVVYKVIRA